MGDDLDRKWQFRDTCALETEDELCALRTPRAEAADSRGGGFVLLLWL